MAEQQLPEGWAKAKISDVSIRTEQRQPQSDENFTYIDIGSIDRETKRISDPQFLSGSEAPSRARKIVMAGDILVSLTRPNLNAVALVEDNFKNQIASTGFEVIRPNGINSRYIYSVVRSYDFIAAITKAVQGALYPAAKSSDVQDYEILLPPLAEQQVIADTLDRLLAQVECSKAHLQRIPQLLKRFRQSVLAAAVSGKLTEEWRSYNSTIHVDLLIADNNLKKNGLLKVQDKTGWNADAELYDLPENWAWVENHNLAIDERNSICAGPFGTIFKSRDFKENGVPIIFLRHVKATGFNQQKATFMDQAVWEKLHQDYSVYGGELLVTKLGDPPGECCIYPEDKGISMVTPDVLKMSVDEAVAHKHYLKFFFNSPVSKKLVAASAFGATRLRIDISLFKKYPVPLPPLKEQAEIVRRVEQLFAYADRIEQQAQAALARVNRLTQAILAKAFRGELTEQWRRDNPHLISGDHSASALLARIQAERAQAPAKGRRGQKAG